MGFETLRHALTASAQSTHPAALVTIAGAAHAKMKIPETQQKAAELAESLFSASFGYLLFKIQGRAASEELHVGDGMNGAQTWPDAGFGGFQVVVGLEVEPVQPSQDARP